MIKGFKKCKCGKLVNIRLKKCECGYDFVKESWNRTCEQGFILKSYLSDHEKFHHLYGN